MILKTYQKNTLAVVRAYFEACQIKSPEEAYAEVAQVLKNRYIVKKAQAGKDYAAKRKKMKLPRLKAVVDGETLFSTSDSYDTLGGSVAAELPETLGANEIGVRAGEGKVFLLKLEGKELKHQFLEEASQMRLRGFSGELEAGDVVNVLDGITKDWNALLQTDKRHWLNQIVSDLKANHGMSYEQMVLVKYQIKQRLDYHYAEAVFAVRKKAYQMSFGLGEATKIELDLENGFTFDEHIYDGVLNFYHGNWEFQKHYLGTHRVPAFDGTGEGEELECAKLTGRQNLIYYAP